MRACQAEHLQHSRTHPTHVGNPSAGWMWTRDQVIKNIESDTDTFYVLDPYTGKRSDVGIIREQWRAP